MKHKKISCGKTKYKDGIAAKLALAKIALKDNLRGKAPIRAYACNLCNGWHLTSKPDNREIVSEQLD